MYLPQNHAFFSYKAKKIIFPGLPRPLKWARNDDQKRYLIQTLPIELFFT